MLVCQHFSFAVLHRFHDYLIDNPPRQSCASLPILNHSRPILIRTHCSCTHTPSYSTPCIHVRAIRSLVHVPIPSVLLCTSSPSLPSIIHVFLVIYFSHTRPWHIYINSLPENTPANIPLPAHCSKPFPHLANLRLRQHAQPCMRRTAQNEAMACELATLHAPTSVSSASDANANTAADDSSSPKAQAGVSKRSSTKRARECGGEAQAGGGFIGWAAVGRGYAGGWRSVRGRQQGMKARRRRRWLYGCGCSYRYG
jgi:hypothetical protein